MIAPNMLEEVAMMLRVNPTFQELYIGVNGFREKLQANGRYK